MPTRAAAAGRASRTPRHRSSPSDCYERFAAAIRAAGLTVAMGSFGAEMQVELVNDGPFTIWLDSADRGPSGTQKTGRRMTTGRSRERRRPIGAATS